MLMCDADPQPAGAPVPFLCKTPQNCKEDRFFGGLAVAGSGFDSATTTKFLDYYNTGQNPVVPAQAPVQEPTMRGH